MAEVKTIPLASIEANPWQPRTTFRPEDLADLASSVQQHGILQPLVVTPATGGRFRLIAGERRLRAARQAGLSSVPAVIRSATEEQQLELALVENVQRQDLNPVERARGYEQLMKRFGLTQEQVAKQMGKSRAAVANALRLLTLPEVIQKAIGDGRLTEGHAKIIVGLETKELQMKFFERVVATRASVRETEDAARKIRKQRRRLVGAPRAQESSTAVHYRELLEEALGTKVEISNHDGSGTVTVHYYSEEELGEIVRKVVGK